MVIGSGLPVGHYTPQVFTEFWRGTHPKRIAGLIIAPAVSKPAVVAQKQPAAAAARSAAQTVGPEGTRCVSDADWAPIWKGLAEQGWVTEREGLVSYFMPPGVRRGETGPGRPKARRDYFDSRKQVLAHLEATGAAAPVPVENAAAPAPVVAVGSSRQQKTAAAPVRQSARQTTAQPGLAAPAQKQPAAKPVEVGAPFWSEEEDAVLVQWVIAHGARNWNACAEQLKNGRSGSACGQHYRTDLRPTHGHKEATGNAQQQQQSPAKSKASPPTKAKPVAAAASAAARPDGASKGSWATEEDEMLIQLVNEYGTKQWSMVASHLKVRAGHVQLTAYSAPPTLTYAPARPLQARNGKQCRERWINNLDPTLNKVPWLTVVGPFDLVTLAPLMLRPLSSVDRRQCACS